jgi:GH24 family phage-related lysozyme (muramidase)
MMENRFTPSAPLGRRGRPQTALLDPIVGHARPQSTGFVRTFSVQDRVLVVLIENGGIDLEIPETARKIVAALPGGSLVPDRVVDALADKLHDWIKTQTDRLLEDAELSLNRYRSAKGSSYGDVVVLRDGTAFYDDLRKALIGHTRAGKLIDVLILTHGTNDLISARDDIDGQKIRDLKTANGGPLAIRTVYMMNCVGSSLNEAWIAAGARASAGAHGNNYLPEPTTFFFWNAWKAGTGFETAVTSAYRRTVNLLNDAINGIVAVLSPTVAALLRDFSIGNADFVRDSAPVVSGARAITINSDELPPAKSLSSSLATTVMSLDFLRALGEAPAAVVPPRKLSPAGLELIKGFETFRARLHNDAYGHCTIGYGTRLHTGRCDGRPVEEPYGHGVSEEQASELLARRMGEVQSFVNDLVKLPLTQNQNDALVSFVSDIGPGAFRQSTVLRLLNAGSLGAVPGEIRKWTRERSDGTTVERPALVARREAEAQLFQKAPAPATASSLSRSGGSSGPDYSIPGAFEIIARPTPNTGWAAVFTMMYCWKNARSTDIPSALATVGGPFLDMYKHDTPLDGNGAQSLYEAAGLVPLTGFDPTVDGWRGLLKKYGPLYVDFGPDKGAATPAIIVTGIAGDGSPGGTSIVYVDPVGGSTVTTKLQDFLARFEARSAGQWPYTIVHWPPRTGAEASLSITGSSTYHNPAPSLPWDEFSRQQNPVAAVIAGIEVADAAQIGLAAAAMVQAQVAATQGSFTLSFDKAERLLTTEARQAMPGAAKGGKSRYERLVLHIPNAHPTTAHADVVVRWEGNPYGEIGTVMIERDLANSSEWSRSSANIVMTWVHQIPTDGSDPRAWPIVYRYSGTYDPLGNGYFEFEGEFQIDAFGEIKFNEHKVYSRSMGDWILKHDTDYYVQRGPTVLESIPAIPKDQLDYLKKHLP